MIPHPDRALVYIAGPFTSDAIAGTRIAIRMAERLEGTGVIMPFVPHMNLLWGLSYHHDYAFWCSTDLALLNRCDALFRLPGLSEGSDAEVEFCEENSIEVYFEIDELIAWAEAFVTAQ